MEVDDAARKCVEHRLFEHAHETGENDQIHTRGLEHFHQFQFYRRFESSAKLPRRKISVRHLEFVCDIENWRVKNIRNDETCLRCQLRCAYLLKNRAAVAAFPGSKNSDGKTPHADGGPCTLSIRLEVECPASNGKIRI